MCLQVFVLVVFMTETLCELLTNSLVELERLI